MTEGASATSEASAGWQAKLGERGWVIVPGPFATEDAERLLGELGELREQYNGARRHEVRARPGFDRLQYSQSRNGITPHTEAPAMPAPPRYLALHCHRQARCGGGQTLLADGYRLVRSLPEDLRREVRARPVRFDLADGATAGGRKARAAPIFTPGVDGAPPIVRYSYNVLRDNSLNAPVRERLDDLEGLDPFNAELCRRGLDLMRAEGVGALPGDGDLLVFDNWRMLHARDSYEDPARHLTRYWVG